MVTDMRWKRVLKHFIIAILIPVFMNIPLLAYVCGIRILSEERIQIWQVVVVPAGFVMILVFWLWINILPYRDKNSPGIRLLIMRGGCTLCLYALYGFLFELLFAVITYPRLWNRPEVVPLAVLVGNGIYAVVISFILLWNGILRMFLLSGRLRLRTRVMMFLAMWIPLLNIAVLLYAVRVVMAEYDFACYKESVRLIRKESELCKTKYPLIMVHGIGFRDLKYFNYWGRIPRELTRYGATVYYGNQEAMGTIAWNAGDIQKKIHEVIREAGCEKVNIIAHSKGGLDSRYAISKLNMGDYVASLTTVCTPHHGCRFVDYACHLPEGLYRFVARCFDYSFRRFGDKNPDFYTATHQFSTEWSQQFNSEVPDVESVFYQSYAAVMGSMLSDLLLWLPYCLIYPLEGHNDGLVSAESAKWGEFRSVFASKRLRGISHGDMIDLKREDYKGFDVVECYVRMVSELAAKGY